MAEAQTHEEVVQSLIREANDKLVEKINQAHIHCVQLAKTLSDIAIESINAARATGLYLIELQDQTPHGQFQNLFTGSQGGKNPKIHFSYQTAWKYFRLARALPEPIKELPEGVRHLSDMLRVTGILEDPTGHGDQTPHEERSPLQALVKYAGEIQGCLSLWRKAKPVDQWSTELRSQVKSQLEPLVKFYQSL